MYRDPFPRSNAGLFGPPPTPDGATSTEEGTAAAEESKGGSEVEKRGANLLLACVSMSLALSFTIVLPTLMAALIASPSSRVGGHDSPSAATTPSYSSFMPKAREGLTAWGWVESSWALTPAFPTFLPQVRTP